jgi:hypothetical protein
MIRMKKRSVVPWREQDLESEGVGLRHNEGLHLTPRFARRR